MRLWSLHPKYLDRAGLLAIWREGLLAKNVLEGNTKGYKKHPQLERFKNFGDPILGINAFLTQILIESKNRGYSFTDDKIIKNDKSGIIKVTNGQLEFEKNHLLNKLKIRDKNKFKILSDTLALDINPVFELIEGEIETWEKI